MDAQAVLFRGTWTVSHPTTFHGRAENSPFRQAAASLMDMPGWYRWASCNNSKNSISYLSAPLPQRLRVSSGSELEPRILAAAVHHACFREHQF